LEKTGRQRDFGKDRETERLWKRQGDGDKDKKTTDRE
jgi:hypothetical protein